ncbi:P-loop containing nucleoside triphosphate hydrolase protein [Biscogniauxia marginata]|nr:P-loop containing nucleoside triphosphate hydrolase protein [Biscogniauxia marginata]
MHGISKIMAAALERCRALCRPVYRGFMAYARLQRKTHQQPFIPSLEQKRIAEASRTMNVVVSALPGSGKTATIWAILQENPTARLLSFVYNRSLQKEMRERFKEYPMCVFCTWHQGGKILFGKPVPDDATLSSLRQSRTAPQWTGEIPDILIADEVQDLYPMLYWLQCMLIESITRAANNRARRAPRNIIFGDECQAINGFRGSDPRHLTHSPSTIGPFSPYLWVTMHLNKSFRLSDQTCACINTFRGGQKYLAGSHTGPKPVYIRANLIKVNKLAEEIVRLIQRYGPENTAILAPFIRKNFTLSSLTNLLSEKYRLPVSIPTSDEVKMDNDVTRGKLCVSTYHQFKGSERDLLVVLGADESYFNYLGRNLPRDVLPNAVFVAFTRARKQLVIIHNSSQAPMPCTQLSQLGTMKECSEVDDRRPVFPSQVAVSQLSRHVSDDILKSITDEHLDIVQVADPGEHIKAPDKVMTDQIKRHFEAVSDLNGIAVFAAYKYKVRRRLVTLGYKARVPTIPINRSERTAWFCKEACDYEAETSTYKSRKIQMAGHSFSWLDEDFLEKTSKRLVEQLKGTDKLLVFEVPLRRKWSTVMEDSGEIVETILFGAADIIVNDGQQPSIWEIKFKGQLSLSDAVQLAIYQYLWHGPDQAGEYQALPSLYLYNVRTGEKWEVTAKQGMAGLVSLIDKLVKVKYFPRAELSTEQFLKECDEIRKEVQEIWNDCE